MNVPLLDLKALYARQADEIQGAIARVVSSQYFIMGPEVKAFEAEMAEFLGGQVEAIGCSSGSEALVLALMALGVGAGDEVIVPTYSFFATASCVTRVGAKPVWVDIEEDSCNLDPELIEARITPRTRAIVPVHLFGRAADLGRIEALLARLGREDIAIVEDSAQSLSARIDGDMVCTRGAVSCLSFFPSKNLGAYGDGGMVVARDPEVAERIKMLRVHGAKTKYFHTEVGLNSRLDALQAAILRVKLPALDGWSEERRANAARYRALFKEASLEEFLSLPAGDGPDGRFYHVYNQFNVQVQRRDALKAHLAAAGVGTAIYYPRPLHLQECFAEYGGVEGMAPVSEAVAQRALALPVFPGLEASQQEYVVGKIRDFYLG